jgi:ketosteroid isomerase-like protein
MSQSDLDVVRRAHDALNAADPEALVLLCDADFTLDMSDRVFNPAIYEGHEGIRRFYAEVREVWEKYVWEVEELIETPEFVLVHVFSSGTGRGSGVEVERQTAMAWTVRDGRAMAVRFFRDRGQALNAAGLRR